MSSSLATPWTAAHQAPLSMGFPRQEYWSGLPFPSPGDLSHPGIEPMSPALAGEFFTTEPSGKPHSTYKMALKGNSGLANSTSIPNSLFLSPSTTSSIQSLSCVRLFVTPWAAAHQSSLFITNSQSLLKLMSTEFTFYNTGEKKL